MCVAMAFWTWVKSLMEVELLRETRSWSHIWSRFRDESLCLHLVEYQRCSVHNFVTNSDQEGCTLVLIISLVRGQLIQQYWQKKVRTVRTHTYDDRLLIGTPHQSIKWLEGIDNHRFEIGQISLIFWKRLRGCVIPIFYHVIMWISFFFLKGQ